MSAPIIYETRKDAGLVAPVDTDEFGPLGEIFAVTFHHSAGPRAKDKAAAQRLHKAFQLDHEGQDWGDIGYHFSMDDFGRIYTLRDVSLKGAHTGGHNTGNVGIMLHGNYDHDELNASQKETLLWLFRGGFYHLTGKTERGIALVRGHQEWPGPTNQTACPGTNLMRHIRYLRGAEFHA